MPTNPRASRKAQGLPNDASTAATLHQTLTSLYLHQDQLYWITLQLLIALQVAALAAGFFLRGSWLSFVVLFGAGGATILLGLYAIKTEKDRDINLPLIDALESLALPLPIATRDGQVLGPSRFTAPPLWGMVRGKLVIRVILLSLILLDIVLPFALLCLRTRLA